MWCGARRVLIGVLFVLLVSAVAIGSREVEAAVISWQDNSGGTTYTRIERRLATGVTFMGIADAPPGATAYVDDDGSPGTTYCYRIFSWNQHAVSPYSDEVCSTPTPPAPRRVLANYLRWVESLPPGSATDPDDVMLQQAYLSRFGGAAWARLTLEYLSWVRDLPPGASTDPGDPILQNVFVAQTGLSATLSSPDTVPSYEEWVRALPPGSSKSFDDALLKLYYQQQYSQ
jgi:hypothetical protein